MIEELEEIIGKAATRRLIARHGSKKLHVPSQAAYDRLQRDRRIVRALARQSHAEVGRRFGLDRATVVRIAKRVARL